MRMLQRIIFFLCIWALVIVTTGVWSAVPAQAAGFGITPPYVRNDRLTRGSVYQQRINLVRGDPVEDLQATMSINVPGIDHWFSIEPGEKFILKKGETQMPIYITVHVPPDAEYGKYEGNIRIRTAPVKNSTSGGVSIALGAQIDVRIEVVDKIYDLEVSRVKFANLEEGHRKWGLYFPGKIRFFMTVENTGNAPFGPTKVVLDIYDANGEVLKETVVNKNKLRRIEPFAIEEIVAEFPTHLPAGKYIAKFTIFKNDKIARQGSLTLGISPYGAIAGYEGYGWDGLSWTDRSKVIGAGLLVLILLAALVLLIAGIIGKYRRTSPRSAQ